VVSGLDMQFLGRKWRKKNTVDIKVFESIVYGMEILQQRVAEWTIQEQ
jgi:hypothetical protein